VPRAREAGDDAQSQVSRYRYLPSLTDHRLPKLGQPGFERITLCAVDSKGAKSKTQGGEQTRFIVIG
jgi:hypothetical protein